MWLIKEDIPMEKPATKSVEELINGGLIILDKWSGPTSHDVVSQVKKIFSLKKTGHPGTLDPKVTGMLPVTLEIACKVIPTLQGLDKEYVGIFHLHHDVPIEKVKEAMEKLVGKIKQTPPVKSAVVRRERTRIVHNFEFLDRNENDVAFKISCQAGTYIRVICHQLGQDLKVGAHMKELRRTKVGRFTEKDLVKIQDVVDAYHFWKEDGDEDIKKFILPVEAAIEHIGKIIVKDSAIGSISNGSPVYSNGIIKLEKTIKKNDLIAILTTRKELIALAKANLSAKEMIEKRGLAAKTDRVIMKNIPD